MTTPIEDWLGSVAAATPAPGRLLDVGCGTKPYAGLFAGWEFVGIDVAESGRPAENKAVDVWFDGLTIPFDEGSFDVVLCTEVLEHAVDPERLASEMHRVLRPEGRVIVTVPFMWGEHEMPYDFRRYSREGIRVLLERAGFVLVEQHRSQPGLAAIETLVASEIRASELRAPLRPGLRKRILDRVEHLLWRSVRALWARRYSFDRLYVDNLVIGMRPPSPSASAKMAP